MANADTPMGFVPTVLCRTRPYSVDASNATGLWPGDLVIVETDGNAIPAAAGSTDIMGACLDLLATTTAGTISVADDPQQEYHAQDDGSGTPVQDDIGGNADHVAADGSAVTNLSAHEIGLSTLTTSTAGIRLLDFVKNIDNDEISDWSIYRCQINEHALSTTTGI